MLTRDEPVVTKCRKCGKKRGRYVLYGKKTDIYRKGKCWDAGLCGGCAARDRSFAKANYKGKSNLNEYNVRVDEGWKPDIKASSNGYLAPRVNRTLPSVDNINKASGKRLVELLDRKIGEIYGL